MSQVDELSMLSQRVRRRMDWFHSANFSPREETITEQVVAELFHGSVGRTKIWKSTAAQESADGHDFRWAIKGPLGTWAHLHVQAKKLARTSPTATTQPAYNELGRNASKNSEALRQCHRLVAAASQITPRSIPIYSFYLGAYPPWDMPYSTPTGRVGKRSQVSLGGCAKGAVRREPSSYVWSTFLGSPLGVILTPAEDVRDALQARSIRGRGWKICPDDLLTNSMPRECLVCTLSAPSGGGSTRPRFSPGPPGFPEIRRLLFDAPAPGNAYLGAEIQPWVGWVVDNSQWMNEQPDDDSSVETEDVNDLLTGSEVLADYPANYYVVSELSEFDAQINSW